MFSTEGQAPSPTMQRNQPQQHQASEQIMIDDDPLMIAQTLTYVTDDGDTVLTFHSAPFSTGEQLSSYVNLGITSRRGSILKLASPISNSIQSPRHYPGNHFLAPPHLCSSYWCPWHSRCCISRQSHIRCLVLV